MIICDRCKQELPEAYRTQDLSAGFYDVTEGSSWAAYARENEKNVCDNCMWSDPKYIAVYGIVTTTV